MPLHMGRTVIRGCEFRLECQWCHESDRACDPGPVSHVASAKWGADHGGGGGLRDGPRCVRAICHFGEVMPLGAASEL